MGEEHQEKANSMFTIVSSKTHLVYLFAQDSSIATCDAKCYNQMTHRLLLKTHGCKGADKLSNKHNARKNMDML